MRTDGDGRIGDSVRRLDGHEKVTGAARYSAEWHPDGLVYAAIAQSTIAKGTITAVDTSAARALPGVIDVLHIGHAPVLPSAGRAAFAPPGGRALSLLQTPEVHYNGEPVALAIATTFEQATHAADLVRIAYAPDAGVVDLGTAPTIAQPYTQSMLGSPPSYTRGDVEAALQSAHAVVDAIYTTPIETHNALEPHATVAVWEGESLTLYDSTQFLYGVKRFVAKTFGIPDDHVRVVSKFVGGAFGSKGSAWSHVVLAAMAAKAVGKPVRLVLTRRQMFGLVGARPHTVQHIRIAATAAGALTAIKQDVVSTTSTLEDWVESSTLQTRMLYDAPNVETTQNLARMNVGTPTFNRGPGESSGTFALESAIDELAHRLALDPLAIRLASYAERDPESGLPWSSKALKECYAKGAQQIGWADRAVVPRARLEDGLLVGIGMATATYGARRQPASAVAKLNADGTIAVQAATHEFGTGTLTVMTQIVADTCGVPLDRVHFELGDTNFPENPISAGSMTATSTGSAIYAVALALRDKVTGLGGDLANLDACRRLVVANGQPIEARITTPPSSEKKTSSSHAFGAVFVKVHVDPDLGQIRVVHAVGAYDVGRILNPKTATSQGRGGIIYGLSMALTERTIIDPRTGRYVNADLAEYLVPVNADVPDIDIIFAGSRDDVVSPVGVKGLGEIGTTGVAAAVANAVFNATGVRVRDLPITLDRLIV